MGATAAMGLTAGQTGANFLGQQQQASAVTSQAAFESRLASLNASDAIGRGDYQASERALQARRTVGAQRAALAASGIDANTGTAAELQSHERAFSALDEQMIKNNAAREAWGYRSQAALNSAGAANEAAALRTQSYSTLLTGAANTYGIYAGKSKNTLKPGGRF